MSKLQISTEVNWCFVELHMFVSKLLSIYRKQNTKEGNKKKKKQDCYAIKVFKTNKFLTRLGARGFAWPPQTQQL